MKIGDKVKHVKDTWYGGKWVGEVKELNDKMAKVKWDQTYELCDGLWMHQTEIKVIDENDR